jgi:translation initiation factor IF-3
MKRPDRVRINEGIRCEQVRVLVEEGTLGVMTPEEALVIAKERGLDLIEITASATPPIVKIMDYGKYQYEQKKHTRDQRAKAKNAMVEIKQIQIKSGTGVGDLQIKAKRASEWLEEGNRVKVELFLPGRTKSMDRSFLHERINRFLTFLTTPYSIAEGFKEIPKGIQTIVEKSRK